MDADPAPSVVADKPGHPVAVPCLRLHCLYTEMEDYVTLDLTYRARLAELERRLPRLEWDQKHLHALLHKLALFREELYTGHGRLTRDAVLIRLTALGI